ncbi:hypothetical protein CBF23_000340 [Marinomonas agarivorans]|nr:hypothetical protein CBF23_000340 [Marinomonas agarivorans]
MTFLWPEESSSEKIVYDSITDLDSLPHFSTPPKKIENNDGFSFGIGIGAPKTKNPFDDYKKKLGKKVTILTNETWPMIFAQRSSTVEQSFYSNVLLNGYPTLQGNIKVTLGRYLETEIHYQHYLFDSFSVPALFSLGESKAGKNTNSILHQTAPILSNAAIALNEDNAEAPTIMLHQPTSILKLAVERKTASKKLNYLDHPIIGSLLYFEPIKVEEAEQEIMLKEIEEELSNELEAF